jgi:glycosyltransferase involved in cell wall biosynthesis
MAHRYASPRVVVPRRDASVAHRPRILFLSQCLPYPPQSGVTSRTFHILEQLQAEFDVTLLAYSRRSHQEGEAQRQKAQRMLARVVSGVGAPVPIAAEHSSARRVYDHLRATATGRPYTFFEYASDCFGSQLRRLVQNGAFDLIHLDSLDLYRWLSTLPAAPTTCTHHSIESQLLRLQAQKVQSRVLGTYLAYQASLLERVERQVCPQFSVNVMMSDTDAERLRSIAVDARTIVVPNGVDTEYFRPLRQVRAVAGRVAFVGATHTFPNRDAVEYLLSEIWPKIRRAQHAASLSLIGGGPAPDGAHHALAPGVTALGHVPDVRPHLAAASCCVVPLRIGGGTRLKILDAWAMGRAVVSTPIGCEGLRAVDGENILIRDEAGAFADAVVQVLEDSELRSQLESNGRRTARAAYDWSVVGRGMRSEYQRVMNADHAEPA